MPRLLMGILGRFDCPSPQFNLSVVLRVEAAIQHAMKRTIQSGAPLPAFLTQSQTAPALGKASSYLGNRARRYVALRDVSARALMLGMGLCQCWRTPSSVPLRCGRWPSSLLHHNPLQTPARWPPLPRPFSKLARKTEGVPYILKQTLTGPLPQKPALQCQLIPHSASRPALAHLAQTPYLSRPADVYCRLAI